MSAISPAPLEARESVVEPDVVRRWLFWGTAAVAVVVIVASVLVALGLLRAFETPRALESSPRTSPPAEISGIEQTLIADARRGLDDRARQTGTLERFAWVDRPRGIAQIPIDDAMDLVGDPAFMARAFPRAPAGGVARTHVESPHPGDGGTR